MSAFRMFGERGPPTDVSGMVKFFSRVINKQTFYGMRNSTFGLMSHMVLEGQFAAGGEYAATAVCKPHGPRADVIAIVAVGDRTSPDNYHVLSYPVGSGVSAEVKSIPLTEFVEKIGKQDVLEFFRQIPYQPPFLIASSARDLNA